VTRRVLADEKAVVTFPRRLNGSRDWLLAGALIGTTVALVAADPELMPRFRDAPRLDTFNTITNGWTTGVALAVVPGVFYLDRMRARDAYGKQTAFALAEALADVHLLTFTAKMIDRRLTPADIPTGGNYGDTWFRAKWLGGKSFPSGHAITAFVLADVFTERYPAHRWIPWVAYPLAAVVGLSRVTLETHFPSDVFAGAALGIVIPHALVLRDTRGR
jgi:membrane-associated phospholipid phosphatase